MPLPSIPIPSIPIIPAWATFIVRCHCGPIVMYGSESWVMTVREEEWLLRWERKILRKILGTTNDKDGWRVKTNLEIQGLFNQPDIVVTIKKGRIRWAGHVQRMPETRSGKKVFFRKT
jgi:hypothetical protein